MKDIKLIAFDLDGTLLNDNKELTEENRRALLEAAEKGIHLVPATGRLPGAAPECLKGLPIRYAIFINGAEVVDMQTGQVISRTLIPWEQAISVFEEAEQYQTVYNCYMGNKGYMNREFFPRIPEIALHEHELKLIQSTRLPVEDLKTFLAQEKQDVQKLLFHFRKDQYDLRHELLLNWKVPGIEVSSSMPNNLELNHEKGIKGYALKALADHLGISMEQTMAFGDGHNDMSMIEMAGIGVAMEVCWPGVRERADYITCSCNDSGVAKALRKFCL